MYMYMYMYKLDCLCFSLSIYLYTLYLQDELAEALVLLFDYKNQLAQFLTRILKTEVRLYITVTTALDNGTWIGVDRLG